MNKLIAEALEAIDRRRVAVAALEPMVEIAEELKAKFPDAYYHHYVGFGEDVISVNFNFASMDEAKDVLRFLTGEKGLRQNGKLESAEYKKLWWRFPGLDVCGEFAKEGAKCAYVKTGEKMVPVYELKCEEVAA